MANLRNPNDYAGYMDPAEIYGYPQDGSWGTPEGNPQVDPVGPPTVQGGKQDLGVPDAVKNLYGGQWDADAQQQYDYRTSLGMDPAQIAAETAKDYSTRFPGAGPGGGQVSAAQQVGPPNIQLPQSRTNPAVMAGLERLFSTGGFNQGIVDRRVESANESLQRQRMSRDKSNRAALASRGILGEGPGHQSGPELTALSRLDSDIAGQFGGAVRDIYADESANADQRMMQALQTAAGLTAQEAQMIIDQFRAETERTSVGNQFELGKGNLALGNMRGVNDYNLALGRLGLDRDRTLAELENADWDRLVEILKSGIDLNTLAGMGYQ